MGLNYFLYRRIRHFSHPLGITVGRSQPGHIAHSGGSSANPLLPYGYLDSLPPIIGPQQPFGPVYPRPAVLSRTHLYVDAFSWPSFAYFRRLLASVSRDTSVHYRATSWAKVWVPLASWPTACKMGVGELFVSAVIRPCIYLDWQVASTALCGVWVCQRAGLVGPGLAGPGPGLGVLGCISSFSSTPLWVVWEQSSASKTTLDIGRVNGSIKRLLESKEELYLGDVGNLAAH